jgi:radical SAM protein (TIGR04043 family)
MIRDVVTELQSFGLRLRGNLSKRKGGAGPAEGGTLLAAGIPVSIPVSSQFVSRSPYTLKEEDGQFFILKEEEVVCPVDLISKPKFYDHSTDDGIPYPQLGLLHGKDCLATTVIQTCAFWQSEERCRFCGIELSHKSGQTVRIKTPDQLSEVACKAKELDSIEHIVLTTGTFKPPGKEISTLIPCASAIKKATGLPIHAQFCPPSHVEEFDGLKEAGVDTVGIHVESFDFETLSHVAPAKAAMGLERYEKAWKMAVEIFGPNQVSSFLIAGLGEKEDSLIEGSEFLADLGVYPFVVPLRPIPGSLMEGVPPPDPERMIKIYEAVASILKGFLLLDLSLDVSVAELARPCLALKRGWNLSSVILLGPGLTKRELLRFEKRSLFWNKNFLQIRMSMIMMRKAST